MMTLVVLLLVLRAGSTGAATNSSACADGVAECAPEGSTLPLPLLAAAPPRKAAVADAVVYESFRPPEGCRVADNVYLCTLALVSGVAAVPPPAGDMRSSIASLLWYEVGRIFIAASARLPPTTPPLSLARAALPRPARRPWTCP